MIILGLNCFYGDLSAAMVRDHTRVAPAEEECFRRISAGQGFGAGDCVLPGRHLAAHVDHVGSSGCTYAELKKRLER